MHFLEIERKESMGKKNHDFDTESIKHKAINIDTKKDIETTYHEILIHVACKQELLQDIIMQSIADIILENGDGVEFIDGDMIALENYNYGK